MPNLFSNMKGIQALRWFAASAVVLAHTDIHQFSVNPKFFEFGAIGVDIFFAISGFIMMYLSEHRSDGSDVFLAKRIIRIVPLYAISTVAVSCLAYFIQVGILPSSPTILYHYPPPKNEF